MTKIKVHIVIGISTLQYYAGKSEYNYIAHVKKNQIFLTTYAEYSHYGEVR